MGKSPGASRIPAGPRETSGGEQRACRRGDPLYAEKAEITPTEREVERERERARGGKKNDNNNRKRGGGELPAPRRGAAAVLRERSGR